LLNDLVQFFSNWAYPVPRKLEHFYEVKQNKTEYVFDEHATFAQASFQ